MGVIKVNMTAGLRSDLGNATSHGTCANDCNLVECNVHDLMEIDLKFQADKIYLLTLSDELARRPD